MSKNLRDTLLGVVLGCLGAFGGLLMLTAWWHFQTGDSMAFFLNDVFWNGGLYQDSIVTLSVLADVVLFYALMRWKRVELARGVMLVILAAVPLVIYLQMVNLESA